MDKQNNILQIILTCTLPFILLIIFAGIFLHAELSLFNTCLTILSSVLLTFYIYNKSFDKQRLFSNVFLTVTSCIVPTIILFIAPTIFFIEKSISLMMILAIFLLILFSICIIVFYLWAIWTKGKIRKILFGFIFVIQMLFNFLLTMGSD